MAYLIKEIPLDQRPRERLIKDGIKALSDEELIAILIRSGYKNNNAKNLAQNILIKLGDITNFNETSINYLANIKGIGPAKAATLMAALEFSKRVLKTQIVNQPILNNPKLIYNMYHDQFVNDKQEKLMAIFLDTKKRLITAKVIFMGTINSSVVHPREVFKEAIKNSAVSIILVHNHPSGDIQPSTVDDIFTNNMIKTGEIIGIKISDHIIIGKNQYYSYYLEQSHLFLNQ